MKCQASLNNTSRTGLMPSVQIFFFFFKENQIALGRAVDLMLTKRFAWHMTIFHLTFHFTSCPAKSSFT